MAPSTKHNKPLDLMLTKQPDYEKTRGFFFEHWDNIHLLGGVNYACFIGHHFEVSYADQGGREEMLAFWLLGAAQALWAASKEGIEDVEDAWGSVQFLLLELFTDEDLAEQIIQSWDFVKRTLEVSYEPKIFRMKKE